VKNEPVGHKKVKTKQKTRIFKKLAYFMPHSSNYVVADERSKNVFGREFCTYSVKKSKNRVATNFVEGVAPKEVTVPRQSAFSAVCYICGGKRPRPFDS
jgi:hypothetical protein